MRFLIMISIFTTVIGACSSTYDRGERQEQQALDSFDRGVGDESVLKDPYGHQPR